MTMRALYPTTNQEYARPQPIQLQVLAWQLARAFSIADISAEKAASRSSAAAMTCLPYSSAAAARLPSAAKLFAVCARAAWLQSLTHWEPSLLRAAVMRGRASAHADQAGSGQIQHSELRVAQMTVYCWVFYSISKARGWPDVNESAGDASSLRSSLYLDRPSTLPNARTGAK